MYPVIILRAGGGALSSDYTTLAEDLASHGYVVVSFDAPYRTVLTAFPDGRVALRTAGRDFDRMPSSATQNLATRLMKAWIADIKFVLDQLQRLNADDPTGRFKGKFDLQKVGVAGHSLGGATAAQFCHDDSRCKAGIDIDGMPFGSVIGDGISRPFFFLMSDHSRESGSEPQMVERNIESIYDRVPEGKRWGMTITGANHFTFSDQMLTKSPILTFLLRRAGVMGSLEKNRGLAITSACIHTFFDVYLKGAPDDELRILPSFYPELRMGFTSAFPHQLITHLSNPPFRFWIHRSPQVLPTLTSTELSCRVHKSGEASLAVEPRLRRRTRFTLSIRDDHLSVDGCVSLGELRVPNGVRGD